VCYDGWREADCMMQSADGVEELTVIRWQSAVCHWLLNSVTWQYLSVTTSVLQDAATTFPTLLTLDAVSILILHTFTTQCSWGGSTTMLNSVLYRYGVQLKCVSMKMISRAFINIFLQRFSQLCYLHTRWRFGVAVTRWSWSTQLLYIEPG